MGRRAVDLFDDPPWQTGMPVDQPTPARRSLVVSLVLVALLISSMALPWFASGETPPWTPFSHWLDLGWSPGTQKWGFLVLALGAVVAISLGIAIPTPGKARLSLLLVVATGLVCATLLEAIADLSVDPGPNLHADYGAWIGGAAAVLAWFGIAVATYISWRAPVPSRQP